MMPATAIAAVGVWMRRTTWRFKWESAATLHLTGVLIGLICWSPACEPLRRALHMVTRVWNMEYLVGHLAYTIGVSALASSMVARIDIPNLELFLRQRFELPITTALPTVSALFIKGAPSERLPLMTLPTTGWLACYWLLISVVWVWMLGHLLWALFVIHQDHRSRVIADSYIAAASVDITAVLARLLSLMTDLSDEPAMTMACVASMIYAGAGIYGMRRLRHRLRPLEGLGPINPVEQ